MEKSDARVQNKKWDKKAFDIHSVKWVEDAYAQKKWAFCCRLYPSLCIIY